MTIRRAWSLLAVSLAIASTGVSAQSDRHEWSVHVDLASATPSSDLDSWVEGSVGKLRYDENHDGLTVGRAFVEYDGRIKPTLTTHVVADYVEDGDSGIDLTEAYFDWRPVPKSENRHRVRFGAFYPRLSLENNGPGWASAYSISSSAINTWIGEEVRTIGAEWSLTRPIGTRASGSEVSFLAAAFWGNDPAGTLLAWKGWSIYDRQTRLNDVLPLPALPQIAPGMMFEHQALRAEPFIETDDKNGYYAGADWKVNRNFLLTAMHYNNHADPRSLRRGQYGWTTVFDHVGAKIELPGNFGLIAQWMDGTTVMGPIVNGAYVVDTAFESYFLLLTRRFDKHRVTLRFDDFAVVDNDEIPLDANDETGDAVTLSYRYDHSSRLSFQLEWLRIETERSSWAYFGLPTRGDERMLQAQVSLRLGPGVD